MKSTRIATLAGLLIIAAGCSPGMASTPPQITGAPASADGTRTVQAGQVTIKAAWGGSPDGLSFEVALDTHSVPLDDITLIGATLTNDRGDRLSTPTWGAPAGGHHRTGRLSFPGDAAAFLASARWVVLTLPGIDGAEQVVIRWDLAGMPDG